MTVDPGLLAQQRAKELLNVGDVQAAREVINEALGTSRSKHDLLWVLADAEFADGDLQAGMRYLTEAVAASGGDAASISTHIQALAKKRLWREALMVVEHLPNQVRDDPVVRTAVGDFYGARGC